MIFATTLFTVTRPAHERFPFIDRMLAHCSHRYLPPPMRLRRTYRPILARP